MDDHYTRLVRLEQSHLHVSKTLDRLAETQEQLVRTVSQMQIQQGELNEIKSALHALDKRSAMNEHQLEVMDGVIGTVGELRDQVTGSKFIERILTSIGGAILATATGLLVFFMQSMGK
jgi:chromosome segregation ATPase